MVCRQRIGAAARLLAARCLSRKGSDSKEARKVDLSGVQKKSRVTFPVFVVPLLSAFAYLTESIPSATSASTYSLRPTPGPITRDIFHNTPVGAGLSSPGHEGWRIAYRFFLRWEGRLRRPPLVCGVAIGPVPLVAGLALPCLARLAGLLAGELDEFHVGA